MAWLTDVLIAIIVLIARHPAIPFVLMIITPIAAAILLPTPKAGVTLSRRAKLSMVFVVLAVIANLMFGDDLATMLIYFGGTNGQATMISSRTLNESYNYHDVVAQDMLLHEADGGIIKVTSRSDDFNIFPVGYRSVAAQDGRFKVRYIKHIPSLFVFVAE